MQARYEALTHEIRCMQCMNNSIADSPVGLASDLRRDVKEMIVAGKTDDRDPRLHGGTLRQRRVVHPADDEQHRVGVAHAVARIARRHRDRRA
ncbi:MAG: cytochrome c-type biogenesis protein CcmH [Nocardioides sp.]